MRQKMQTRICLCISDLALYSNQIQVSGNKLRTRFTSASFGVPPPPALERTTSDSASYREELLI